MNNIITKAKGFITTNFISFDKKIATLIPNTKVKKIAYIGIGSLFSFMFLIIILGLLFSPLRNNKNIQNSTLIKKPNIVSVTPEPVAPLSETQKSLLGLEENIKSLRFPESILNIPILIF